MGFAEKCPSCGERTDFTVTRKLVTTRLGESEVTRVDTKSPPSYMCSNCDYETERRPNYEHSQLYLDSQSQQKGQKAADKLNRRNGPFVPLLPILGVMVPVLVIVVIVFVAVMIWGLITGEATPAELLRRFIDGL